MKESEIDSMIFEYIRNGGMLCLWSREMDWEGKERWDLICKRRSSTGIYNVRGCYECPWHKISGKTCYQTFENKERYRIVEGFIQRNPEVVYVALANTFIFGDQYVRI